MKYKCVPLVLAPDQQWIIDEMRDSSVEDYNKLADITISLDNDPDYSKTDDLVEYQVIRDGTHAHATTNEDISVFYQYLEEKYDTRWYRSTETVMSESPTSHWIRRRFIKKK